MQEYSADPRKVLTSRLWCWGGLILAISLFVVVKITPLQKDASIICIPIYFMFFLQPVIIYFAERDYAKSRFRYDGHSLTHAGHCICVKELDCLIWQRSIFPQTDNGGCGFVAENSKIEIEFRYLPDTDALDIITHLRATIPVEIQKHWAEYCHSTALRIFSRIHHPERKYPDPTKDEAAWNESQEIWESEVMNG